METDTLPTSGTIRVYYSVVKKSYASVHAFWGGGIAAQRGLWPTHL